MHRVPVAVLGSLSLAVGSRVRVRFRLCFLLQLYPSARQRQLARARRQFTRVRPAQSARTARSADGHPWVPLYRIPVLQASQSAEMATSLAGDHIDGTPKRALNPTCSIPPGTATPNYLTLLLLHSSSGHHCRIEFLTMGSPHGILSTQTGRPFFSHLR